MDRVLCIAVVGALQLGGCTKRSCDDQALRALAADMRDRSAAGRSAAFEGLAQACPELPQGLMDRLMAGYAELPADLQASIYGRGNPEYATLRHQACPVSDQAWRDAIVSEDRDVAVFEVCDLVRFGLLEDGERFVMDDFDAFVLHMWLTSTGNREQVSRELVRGLLSATASDPAP